jgi:hypothetical protein
MTQFIASRLEGAEEVLISMQDGVVQLLLADQILDLPKGMVAALGDRLSRIAALVEDDGA